MWTLGFQWVWGGGAAWMEEIHHWAWALRLPRLAPFPVLFHSLCSVLAAEDMSSQVPAPAAMPAAWCHGRLWSLWNVSHDKLLPYVTFGPGVITGTERLTNTRSISWDLVWRLEMETGFLWEKIWVEKKIKQFQMARPIWLWSKTVMKIGNISGKSITQDKLREDVLWGSPHEILGWEDSITRFSQI